MLTKISTTDYQLVFYFCLLILGILFIITSLCMILTESSIHSILYLMFLFLFLTELTIILKMEFLALIFIIIYIGAVCVLMLFQIKLIKTFIHRQDTSSSKFIYFPFLIVTLFLPLIEIITLSFEYPYNRLTNHLKIIESIIKDESFNAESNYYYNSYISWIDNFEMFEDTQILGFLLYNIYFIYLILGAFILLIAMIGSIFLTLLNKKDKKFQKIHNQFFIEIQNKIRFK